MIWLILGLIGFFLALTPLISINYQMIKEMKKLRKELLGGEEE